MDIDGVCNRLFTHYVDLLHFQCGALSTKKIFNLLTFEWPAKGSDSTMKHLSTSLSHFHMLDTETTSKNEPHVPAVPSEIQHFSHNRYFSQNKFRRQCNCWAMYISSSQFLTPLDWVTCQSSTFNNEAFIILAATSALMMPLLGHNVYV